MICTMIRMKKTIGLLLGAMCFSFQLCSQTYNENIHVDQFGYLPQGIKVAVLSDPQVGFNSTESYTPGGTIQVRNRADNSIVFSGSATTWDGGSTHVQSGDKAWWFDFSSVTDNGEYYIYDPSTDARSSYFKIEPEVYDQVLKHAVRAFYYQRCGVEKAQGNGGDWNDVVCHNHAGQDLDCRLVTDPNNASTSKDLAGGWHDAGDYNKYVNFCHKPIHDLLYAYEDHPDIWEDNYNIPESGNGTPDILDEIKVELDWLLKMQEADGSCLMKVSVTGFQGSSPPSTDMAVRRYGPAQASSTRALASVIAHAAVVYEKAGLSDYAATLLQSAESAWNWVDSNPGYSTYDNAGFSSANPEVSTSAQDDYRMCAAVYLYAATGEVKYRNYIDANYTSINPIAWTFWYVFQTEVQDALLYYADLPTATPAVATAIQNSFINSMHGNNGDMVPAYLSNSDPYRAFMSDGNYVWGNNREKSSTSLMYHNMIKYGLDNGGSNDSLNYDRAAKGYLHFIHGVNPINMVMLSNMYDYGAENSADEIYHLWFDNGSVYDNALTSLYGPPPGIVPGGFNPNYSPDASYTGPTLSPPLNQPIQKSYKDWNTSFPENSWEITENSITYQGPYINMLSKHIGNRRCAVYRLLKDLVYDENTTISAASLIELDNVSVTPSHELILKSSEVAIKSASTINEGAQIVVRKDGCGGN